MAAKLSKKDLSRTKTDFDFPGAKWKTPPGQTSLSFDDENGAQREKGKGRGVQSLRTAGRPRKHDKPGRAVSFWLTDDAIKKIRMTAAARGISAADLLHEMIEAL